MKITRKLMLDIVERVLGTFVATAVSCFLASGFDIHGLTGASGAVKLIVVPSLAAAFTVVKSLVATQVGDKQSAALLPAVVGGATGSVVESIGGAVGTVVSEAGKLGKEQT